ncbi:ATP-binding protein [Albimonas sp. CAU 1670]|uniref:hybrid sensor histidine kinase/response regulator n=1 Tax=Albimonas sp. CAU 1670 TaxID=3032599 RepID=UPI0023DC2AB7|nr:ATP-binding protein [Albimonas sp. CAU 1670]MDF2235051.1 ATP-binding protein [Albimonas sp. CAU 1670]
MTGAITGSSEPGPRCQGSADPFAAARRETRRRLEAWAGGLAGVVLITSLATLLLGWGLGLDALVRIDVSAPAMVPPTAMCLSALAAALLLRLPPGWSRAAAAAPKLAEAQGRSTWTLAGIALATAAGIYAAVRIATTVFAYIQAPPEAGDRMALGTSVGVLLAAICAVAATGHGRLADRTVSILCALGATLTLTALGTWVLDRDAYDTTLAFVGMSPQTSAALTMMFMATLLSRPDFQLMRNASGPGVGSRAARILLPLSLLGPLLLAELAILAADRGLLDVSVLANALGAALAMTAAATVLRLAGLRNREEAQARRQEAQMRAALDGIDAAVFVFGPDRRLRMTNRGAERLSAGARSPARWLFEERFHALGDRRRLRPEESPARRLLEGTRRHDLWVGWMDPGGAEHALRFGLRRPADGELQVLSVQDETQGWALRENLSRTERLDAIGQMAGGVAHETANIFGVIRLSADTALLAGDAETTDRRLRAIQLACGRGAELTERLLALVRNRAAEAESIDLAPALEEAVEIARAALPDTIRIELAPLPEGTRIHAAPVDLQAAVLNLAVNARNAILEHRAAAAKDGGGDASRPAGGLIRISATRNGALRLTVADDGPGMPEWLLSRAAEPFYTTRLTEGGSGLGLAMVDTFARRLGGTMELASSPGQGVEATLVLPLNGAVAGDPPHREDEESAPLRLGPRRLAGRRILVVEEDPGFGGLVLELLETVGAVAVTARTAEEALELAHAGPRFDLLLTDVLLPGRIGGLRLAERIQTEPLQAAQGRTPVVYMSSYVDPLERDAPHVPGLFLRKPVGAATLVNALDISLAD